MNRGTHNQNNMNMPNIQRDTEEFLYPEVFQIFGPIVDQLLRDMERQYGEIYLSEDLLNQMADEAIRRSGIDNNMQPVSNADMDDSDAVQTMAMNNLRHDRRCRDRGCWRRYDRSALSDIYKILILQQIFGRRRPNWRWR